MEFFKRERKVLDAETTISEIIQHSLVNFAYGLTSGLTIATMLIGNIWVIGIAYYVHKQFEGKILNRNKYTSRLGKQYIYPIPSTIGFALGYVLSELLKGYLKINQKKLDYSNNMFYICRVIKIKDKKL